MSEDLLEQAPHAEIVAMALVVIDVAAGYGGAIQVIHERLLFERQLVEAVRIQLNHGRIVDLLEQIRPCVRWRIGSHRSVIGFHLRHLSFPWLITERLPSGRASALRHASPAPSQCAASARPAPRFRHARGMSPWARGGTCAASG